MWEGITPVDWAAMGRGDALLGVAITPLDEAKGLGLDSQEKLLLQDGLGAVERDVKAADAGVGRGQVVVVWWPHRDGRQGLEPLLAGRQARAGRPEVHLENGGGPMYVK